jgi:hypothetical protein
MIRNALIPLQSMQGKFGAQVARVAPAAWNSQIREQKTMAAIDPANPPAKKGYSPFGTKQNSL